ncbi:MAG: flagellar biosynthetic protein FliO [Candidatus Margulisbacteria bacterium]|nr:flagellar biosynthetic protein FliO [Candidatus Margulisiibacteriota bacterium]
MSAAYYFQILFSLLIFFGLVYGLFVFSKRVQKKRFSGDIKVTDRLLIGNHASLVIVTIRSHEYLISVGGKDIRLLEKLS